MWCIMFNYTMFIFIYYLFFWLPYMQYPFLLKQRKTSVEVFQSEKIKTYLPVPIAITGLFAYLFFVQKLIFLLYCELPAVYTGSINRS